MRELQVVLDGLPDPVALPSRPLDRNCQVGPEHAGSSVQLVPWQGEVGRMKRN